MNIARPVRLRHSLEWGASVPNHDIHGGDLIIIETRRGKRLLGEVRAVVHRTVTGDTIVSLKAPGTPIPSPKKAP